MKTIKKAVLKEAEVLTNTEMKNLFGGSSAASGSSSGSGEDSPKIAACKGKKSGDACSFIELPSGSPSYGKCRSFLGTALHCSDLK